MKIGIIGTGFAGQMHSKVLEIINPSTEYYIYDIDPKKADELTKQRNNGKAIYSLEDMYRMADSIIISTPTTTHFKLAINIIKNNKNVLCEKPMALTLNEAKMMLTEAKKNKKICSIGFNYRFFKITQILKEKELDDIIAIKVTLKRLYRSNGWHSKENGVLADLGIHLIDYITYICNDSIDLKNCVANKKYIDGWDYYSNICGKTKSGINFDLVAARTDDPKEVQFSFIICTKKGVIKYDSREENTYSVQNRKNIVSYKFEKELKTDGFFDFTDSVLKQDRFWIESIENNKKNEVATFADGIEAQKILEYFNS